MKQDDSNINLAGMHTIGFLALLEALRLLFSGTPSFGRLVAATIFLVPATVFLIRDLRYMTLRSFGAMFFCLAFFGLVRGFDLIRNGHLRYSARFATTSEIYTCTIGGMICLFAGIYCFWRHIKQSK